MGDLDYSVDDGVATITIQRQQQLNALDSYTRLDIMDYLDDVKDDDNVRVVVLRGEGENFCAGGDMSEFEEYERDNWIEGFEEMVDKWIAMFDAMKNLGKPTIAQVDGYALGGGFDVLLFADIVVAAEDSTLGIPEIEVGMVEIFGSAMLPHIAGIRNALEILMVGETMNAAEAERLGIVNRVVPAEELDDEVAAITDQLCEHSPRILRKLKDIVYTSYQMSPNSAMKYARRESLNEAREGPDFPEGFAAFLEDREPEWRS